MPIQDFIQPIRSSKTLSYVFWLALLTGLYALIPTSFEYTSFYQVFDQPSEIHAALSLVLGWLLVFRTNTAYNRWWEARTLWGALVNASRNLATKTRNIGRLPASDREQIHKLLVAFPVALCCHLRDETETKLPKDVRDLAGDFAHVPQALVNKLYAILGNAKNSGRIDGDDLRVLDAELLRLLDICGGCERIKKTRIVKSYRIFARQCVLLFLATLPWGIVHDFRWLTVPLTIIIAYFMLGLETVAEHVEEPFGYDEDDLDLEGLCTTIEKSVGEVFA